MEYIKRHIEDLILKLNTQYPVIMICGQRQAGKSTMLRHIAESDRKYVTFGDAKTRNYNNGKSPNLYYYRDIDQKEIDLLMVEGDKIYPIEIKKNKMPSNPDKNFSVLDKFGMNVMPGIIICMTEELIPYNKNCWLCPISLI